MTSQNIAWSWRWPEISAALLVSQAVAETFKNHKQSRWKFERGGQLFVDPKRSEGLVLALATRPHTDDKAGWSWLQLDKKRCEVEINESNKRGLRLIGYWHTHPESSPQISKQDVKSFELFARQNQSELPQPLAVIVGTKPFPDGIKAWSLRPHGEMMSAIPIIQSQQQKKECYE